MRYINVISLRLKFQTVNVVRNLRRLVEALQRERIHAIDIYTHRNGETDFEGGRSIIATELQDVDKMLEIAMRRLDKMKQRKKIKLQIGQRKKLF